MNLARKLLPLLCVSLAPALVLAQPRQPAQPAPTAPSSSASPSLPPITAAEVTPPAVDDPLLEPVPPAQNIVASWREALSLVKSRSVDLRSALLDLERTEAQARVALASSLPQLSASANVSDQLIRTTVEPIQGEPRIQLFPPRAINYGLSASLSIPIFAPRAWYNLGTVEQQQKVSRLTLVEQRRVLAASVADALVSVISAERVAELNRLGLRSALERLALTKKRADLGVANAVDVLRVQQDATSARASIISGDESLRQAREALGLALGFSDAYSVPKDLNLDAFVQESEQACSRVNDIEERADISVARERVTLAERGVRDVELSFLPTADLRTTYSITIQPFYNDFRTNENPELRSLGVVDHHNTLHAWSISGTLSWNLFDGGARYGNLRDQRVQVEQAELRVESARRSAAIEVQRAMRVVSVAESALKVASETRDLAKDSERLTRMSFDLGKGTSLELVDAGRALRQAEIQLALKEFDVIQAKIRALLALSVCDY